MSACIYTVGNRIICIPLPSGAQVGLQNAEGETPLLLAEYAKFEEVAKLLREAMQQAGIPEGMIHVVRGHLIHVLQGGGRGL